MLVIPTRPVASQILTVQLASQPCKIVLSQRSTGLFVDVYVNDSPVILGVIAQHANRIVRDAYLGFIGDLAFFDTTASTDDPYYTGLGGRWVLMYIEAAEL